MSKYAKIILMVVICLAVGYISSTVTQSGVKTWYPTLVKPFFNPPNWVFAPVWTALYILMGVAAALVWDKINVQKEDVKKALLFFGVQLLLNSLWSYLFFGLHNIFLAAIEIVILLLLIYETFVIFKRIDKNAGYMLIPYLAWVGFATMLNISFLYLN